MNNKGRNKPSSHPRLASRRNSSIGLLTTLIVATVIAGVSYLAQPPTSEALSSGVVISQINPNGGSTAANFRNDFIELFNRGNTPVSVAGWSVQYAVGNGAQSSTWAVTPICGGSCVIQPHSYFLVQEASGGANGALLPTPDATGTIDLSPNNGKVALVNNTTSLTGGTGCPFPASVVDFVGYGNSANCSEGNAVAPNPGNNDQSICRNGNGFTETDNNTNDFTLCTPNPRNSASAPAFAKLNQFKATRYDDNGVLLEWRTGYEVDNLGFNIYRERNGKRTRINSQLIAGSSLMVGPAALTAGHSYSFWDDAPYSNDVVYWIEDVALSGRSTWHDPIAVDRSGSRKLQPHEQHRAVFLDSLGRTQDPTASVETRAGLVKPTTALLDVQSKLASRGALKLAIRSEGWYRVTQPELAAAGLDPATNPDYLQMFVDGHEQPINVTTESDGTFGPNSSIEFYGVGIDAPSTDRHIYWLVAGSSQGARTQRVKGKGSRPAASSFPYTVERKDRTVYFSALRNGEKENFFGAVVMSSPVDQSLLVRGLDKTSEEAELEVAVQGVSYMPHRVKVSLNDRPVGEIAFFDQELGVVKLAVPPSLLKEGQNEVSLISVAGDRDISLVDHLRLTYWRTYTADDNALRFTAQGKQQVSIDGFSNPMIRVMDITDPNDVQEVATSIEQKGSYSVTFSAPGKRQRNFFAFAADRIVAPVELIADQPSRLRGSREGADFVIITRRELSSAIDPLKLLRESQGLKVAVVDIEDIYDEFSFGQKTPQAVRDFLAFAKSNWNNAPRYVLLAGDASLDPKNYLDKGDFDFVPTKLVDTRLMETASDDWFTDFDDDGSADIPTGRLPVRTAQQAASMIGKIIGYESSAKPDGVLLVTDNSEGFNFAAESAELKPLVPASLRLEEVDRGKAGDAMARTRLLDGLNRGPRIVNYVGHGSVDLWSGSLLEGADAGGLTNRESLSLFVAMTCLNGYFMDPTLDSLAEALLKNDQGGAVAVWASSGMTSTDRQAAMDQQMFRLLLGVEGSLRLGDAAVRAKAETTDPDVRRTWILFGDPAMRVR